MKETERQGYLKAEFAGEKGIGIDIKVGPCDMDDLLDMHYCIVKHIAELLLDAVGKRVEEDGKDSKRFIADNLAGSTLASLKNFLGESMEDNKDESEEVS